MFSSYTGYQGHEDKPVMHGAHTSTLECSEGSTEGRFLQGESFRHGQRTLCDEKMAQLENNSLIGGDLGFIQLGKD